MSAQPKPNEPSMEEILASIRRIIADDETKPAEGGEPAAEAAPAAPEVVEAEPEPEDDVLDLGAEAALLPAEPVSPEPAPAPPPAPRAAPEPAGDLMFVEAPEPAPLPPPAVETRAAERAPEPAWTEPAPTLAQRGGDPMIDMAALISDQTSSSVASAFGHLANTVLSNNARTLEDLVKDMLRPMLKTWLDDNLPSMVERLVRAEIERVARGGRN